MVVAVSERKSIQGNNVSEGLSQALCEVENKLKEKGLSRRYFCERLGMAEETLSRAFHGDCRWTNQELITTRIRKWVTRPEEIFQLEKWMIDNNVSIHAAAKQSGVSVTTISGLLDGNYFRMANGGRVLPKIKDFLWSLEARVSDKKRHVSFIETRVAKDIFSILNHARTDRKKIALLALRSGLGKSTTLRRYAWGHPGTHIIEGFSGMRKGDIIYYLAGAYRIARSNTTPFRVIFSRLTEEARKEPDKLFVIDQANKLAYEALDILQDFKEASGVGMALVGTKELLRKLKAGAHGEYEQLWSRLRPIYQRDAIEKEDANKFIMAHFPDMNGKLTDEHLKLFFMLGGGAQCTFRTLENLIEESQQIMKAFRRELDKSVIEAAAGNILKAESV